MTRIRYYRAGIVILLIVVATLVAFVIPLFYRLNHVVDRLNHDEAVHASEVAQVKKVQHEGEPVGVCLLQTFVHVAPLLERVPEAQQPLEAYIHLQSDRYPGVTCPIETPKQGL